jgi:tRNA/rRNA methyltransferase
VADLQRVMATTVRPRHMTQMVYTPSAASKIAISQDTEVKVGIMFGTERSGLTNEDVAEADAIISIPSFKHFSSLNLAQAVNIVGTYIYIYVYIHIYMHIYIHTYI